jgi:hypothetical protein
MPTKKKTLDLSTAKGLREFYRIYNHYFFGGRLPENVVVCFEKLSRMDAAYTDFWGKGPDRVVEITLDERLRGLDCVCGWHMIHEMAHVDMKMTNPRVIHGPKFDKRMLQLAVAGAFEGIW